MHVGLRCTKIMSFLELVDKNILDLLNSNSNANLMLSKTMFVCVLQAEMYIYVKTR